MGSKVETSPNKKHTFVLFTWNIPLLTISTAPLYGINALIIPINRVFIDSGSINVQTAWWGAIASAVMFFSLVSLPFFTNTMGNQLARYFTMEVALFYWV